MRRNVTIDEGSVMPALSCAGSGLRVFPGGESMYVGMAVFNITAPPYGIGD